jgi:hypothetical protein
MITASNMQKPNAMRGLTPIPFINDTVSAPKLPPAYQGPQARGALSRSSLGTPTMYSPSADDALSEADARDAADRNTVAGTLR